MNKIIFIDIDGVICKYPEHQKDWPRNQNNQFDAECCKRIKNICDSTGAKMVVTSSWRIVAKEDMIQQFINNGITEDYIVGYTVDYSKKDAVAFCKAEDIRWFEIDAWIRTHGHRNYIIIDDWNIIRAPIERMIRTDMHEGITSEIEQICINKFSKEVPGTCEKCINCVYISSGDFFCDERQKIVMENFEPTYFPSECGNYYEPD